MFAVDVNGWKKDSCVAAVVQFKWDAVYMLEQQDLALINHMCSQGRNAEAGTRHLCTRRGENKRMKERQDGGSNFKKRDRWWLATVEAQLHLHTGCDGEKRPGDERRERWRCEGKGACRQSHLLN